MTTNKVFKIQTLYTFILFWVLSLEFPDPKSLIISIINLYNDFNIIIFILNEFEVIVQYVPEVLYVKVTLQNRSTEEIIYFCKRLTNSSRRSSLDRDNVCKNNNFKI